jgi:hypothetical protein
MGRTFDRKQELRAKIQNYEAREAEQKSKLLSIRLKMEKKTKIPFTRLLNREKSLRKSLANTRRYLVKNENEYRQYILKSHKK